MGQAPPSSDCNKVGDGIPFVKAGEFGDRWPSIREWTTRRQKLARHDDVLVCVVGATAGKVNQGIDCAIGRSVAAVRPTSPRIMPDYLYRFMATRVATLRAGSQGLAQGVITRDMLLALAVPLPALDEQQRISTILDQTDALQAKRRTAIALANALPASVFDEMFGAGDSSLSRWPTKPLAELLTFLTSGSRGWAKHYSESGSLFLRIQNVRVNELTLDDVAFVRPPRTAEAARTLVHGGDVLLSITADLGRTAVVPEDMGPAYINQHLAILRVPSLVPEFLSAFLASPAGQRQIFRRNRHAVKAGLNFDDIRSIRVPIPPLAAQRTYAARQKDVVRQLRTSRHQAVHISALASALQQRAFPSPQ